MRFTYLSVVAGLLLASLASAAPTLKSPAAVGAGDLPQFQVVSSSQDGLTLLFELPTLAVEEMSVANRTYQLVTIPGGGLAGEAGAPALPTFTRFISIPDEAGVSVSAVPEDEQELTGYTLLPMQQDEGNGFAYDAAAYARDGYGDAPPSLTGRPALSRDLRVVPVTIQPVQYNPARGTLKVAGRVRIEVRFQGRDLENANRVHRRTIAPSFDRLYRELVVNYSGPPAGVSVQPGTYLMICPNSSAITSRVQPLLDWRQRKGTPVYLATTAETGNTTTSIKAFIQNAYDTWANPPEYVCLVGDANGSIAIPTWHENCSSYHGEGDLPYVQLAGGDVLADAHVGRLSASTNAELETEVAKVIGYESTPYQQDPGWYTRACLVGDPNNSGWSCVQVQQWIKNRIQEMGYTQIDTIFNGNFVSQMTTALNRGDTIMSYRGYYQMSGWGNSNTYALTNGWKMPFVVAITCDTGSFESDASCRTEGFLRAGSAQTPKGGIGAIGTATTGTHTRFNNCIHCGIFYGLLYSGQTTMGAALTRGRYELYLNYENFDPTRVCMFSHWNNLMGDPAVDVWTAFPDPVQVSAPASIPVGANSVTVNVLDNHGAPLENAQVCLWKGTDTYITGYTDASGNVELAVKTGDAGSMLLTVSDHNRASYIGSIPVVSQPTYVAYVSSVIDDSNTGPGHGNGDGLINPGEGIGLTVTVRNFGTNLAAGVTGTITSQDPYVSITTADATFGDIPAGVTATSAAPFVFSVDYGCPDRHVVRLGLDLACGSDRWHSLIDLPIVSAHLITDGYHVYSVGGDGIFDPGETGQLSISLKNVGEAPAVNPTATLLSMSQYVHVIDGNANYETINLNGDAENTTDQFTIQIAPDCIEGYNANMKLLLQYSGGARDTTYLLLPIGTRTVHDPTGPDRYGYWAFDNMDIGYTDAPFYATWIEIDPAHGGDGTEIVLGDTGDWHDATRTVDLPFSFQYYGNRFTQASVCSNGWMAMGVTHVADYRNWTIPSAGGPEWMIAPFWDDLVQSGGGKVLQKFDATNHRWIVEWSRMKNGYDYYSNETFEVILLDPAYYPTDTGDGKILFLYYEIHNIDAIDEYATVGIENGNKDDGVLYSYYNQYTPGSATLGLNLAIAFVPKQDHPAAAGDRVTYRFDLAQNNPNPFLPNTAIRFSLDRPMAAQVTIYDVQGRVVRRLVDAVKPAGSFSVVWDGRDATGQVAPSGVYLYRLDAGGRSQTRKMILLQ